MKNVNLKNVVICNIDEWSDGRVDTFDCNITDIREDGIDVIYLSGYRSRNDFVKWEDVLAKVDKRCTWKKVGAFSGHFKLLDNV